MKWRILEALWLVPAFVMIMTLRPSHARADAISVQFTGSYTTTFSDASGTHDAGIYGAQINGVTSSSGIISDDFNDEITAGETWNANAYQASSLTSSNLGETLFGSSIGLTGYAEVATLVEDDAR